MKKVFSILTVISISFVLSVVTLAQTTPIHTPRINRRERDQRQRIRQGIRSGELTRGEARHIERNERGIRQDERAAKADGVVTPAERKTINRDLNKTNRQIWRSKHNRWDRN